MACRDIWSRPGRETCYEAGVNPGGGRSSGGDEGIGTDAAAPDGEEPAQTMDQHLPPAAGERRWRAAQEPHSRLDRERVNDEERVHPAPMGRPDEQVPATR